MTGKRKTYKSIFVGGFTPTPLIAVQVNGNYLSLDARRVGAGGQAIDLEADQGKGKKTGGWGIDVGVLKPK